MFQQHRPSEGGYTLAEALVVVAIIGLISLVTIPNFMNYRRQQEVRFEARQFVMNLRTARQTAISEYHPTKIGFQSGPGQRTYSVFDGVYDSSAAGGIAWTQDTDVNCGTFAGGACAFGEVVFFESTTFIDSADDDSLLDIIFLTNGSVDMDSAQSTVAITTELDVPRPSYTVSVSRAGRIRME